MNIVCCTDHNYVMPTGIMICSVCVNHTNCNVKFHVICNDDVTDEDKTALINIACQYHHSICFYPVNIEVPHSFTINKTEQPKHITIAAYYRLFLVEILPANIDKVLYLDSDVIVRHSLQEMYNTDIHDYAVGAITDCFEGNIEYYNRLRYSPSLGYFNSGVLLVNLEYWRQNKILQEGIDFATMYPERIVYHDQDILNYLFKNKKKTLSLKFNLQNVHLYKKIMISWEYETELYEAINDPYIIHYTSSCKPWKKKCTNPYKNEFLKYKMMTQWKDTPLWKAPKITWKLKIKKLFENIGLLPKTPSPYISVPSL